VCVLLSVPCSARASFRRMGSRRRRQRVKKKVVKAGDVCPHCRVGLLERVEEDVPFYEAHLQCPKCDSTYSIEDEKK